MSAHVVPYPAHPEDTTNTLMIECRECGIEWGWTKDRPGATDRLQANADAHNADRHPSAPGSTESQETHG
jgi:hypothetical protein